jgi:hypothetical protein
MAVTRQRPVNSNRQIVFSARSAQRCYKQDKLVIQLFNESVSEPVSELYRGLLQFSCEKLVAEGTVWEPRGRGRSVAGSCFQATTVKT